MSGWDKSVQGFDNITDKMYDKAKKYKFYLGCSKFVSNDEWGYKWAKEIVERKTGSRLNNKITTKRKKNIPKSIKKKAWEKYVGNEIGKTKCPVCNSVDILQSEFHGGHIISDKDGGKCTVDNIKPICPTCNISIGSKNMDEYVKEYHPENFDRYKSGDYKPKSNKFFKIFKK